MTYPDSILTKPVRRAIMIFLFIIFFIASPIIILYTAGYRYNFSTNEIKETGVLSIDAKPRNAIVYLNEVLLDKKIPIHLPNRAPGTYKIKISTPGYQDWVKDITIESKQTTYIKNITLFKYSTPTQILNDLDKNIIDVIGSYDGNYLIILTVENEIYEIYLYDTKQNTTTSLSRIKTSQQPKINWSPFNNHLTIQTFQSNEYNLQILDSTNQDNSKIYTYNSPIKYQWSKNSFIPTIYLQHEKNIYLLSTENEQLLTTASSTASAWYGENQNTIWTYQNKILSNNQTRYNLEDNQIDIIDINENRIIFQTGSETKVAKINNNTISEIRTLPTQQIIYNAQTDEWISWSWWELWSIYNNGDLVLLKRIGEKMIFINPLDKYGVLLLSNENKAIGFNPGYYTNHELINQDEIKKISVNIINRKIYFWGTADGKTGMFELEY